MNSIGLEYGNWLGGMKWDYLATIRTHYSLTPTGSDRMMSNLIKYKNVDRLFFVLERDYNCQMNHVHLMLKTNTSFDRDVLAKSLHVNNKAVGYFDSVLSPEAVSYYCTKHITKSFSHHNFFIS
jgi:hypothetical protein